MVLMGQRRTEQRHDSIAHDLVDSAFIAVDSFHHMFKDGSRIFRASSGSRSASSSIDLHVSKQHCDVFALAFESALGGENLFGEVFGGVGLR